jgi:hypothetical protein
MDYANNSKKKLSFPQFSPDSIFPAGSGRILLRTDDKVYDYDITSKEVLHEVSIPAAR